MQNTYGKKNNAQDKKLITAASYPYIGDNIKDNRRNNEKCQTQKNPEQESATMSRENVIRQ